MRYMAFREVCPVVRLPPAIELVVNEGARMALEQHRKIIGEDILNAAKDNLPTHLAADISQLSGPR